MDSWSTTLYPKRFLPARNPMTSCDKRHVIQRSLKGSWKIVSVRPLETAINLQKQTPKKSGIERGMKVEGLQEL